ncbi:MAG: DUF3343 domain-containing protein [Candidatus Obscuribacterales bacterium]|nr:DUF3343 domain-containing protein [Candidatus Obscuribacterales bacterium]
MTRSILTFETVFQVLAAEKTLSGKIQCRTVPTPAGLSSSICGMSLEVLQTDLAEEAVRLLRDNSVPPVGLHQVS